MAIAARLGLISIQEPGNTEFFYKVQNSVPGNHSTTQGRYC